MLTCSFKWPFDLVFYVQFEMMPLKSSNPIFFLWVTTPLNCEASYKSESKMLKRKHVFVNDLKAFECLYRLKTARKDLKCQQWSCRPKVCNDALAKINTSLMWFCELVALQLIAYLYGRRTIAVTILKVFSLSLFAEKWGTSSRDTVRNPRESRDMRSWRMLLIHSISCDET